jgi:hypothetical protein
MKKAESKCSSSTLRECRTSMNHTTQGVEVEGDFFLRHHPYSEDGKITDHL